MESTMEQWKSVVGYDGLYEVSDAGRIRNRHGLILRQYSTKTGYLQLTLCRDGGQITVKVHRLVLGAFTGPSSLPVNHRNGLKADNRLVNLEWTTPRENALHAHRTGLQSNRGHKQSRVVFTEAEVRAMRVRVWLRGEKEALARAKGVSSGAISNIISGRSWGWLR